MIYDVTNRKKIISKRLEFINQEPSCISHDEIMRNIKGAVHTVLEMYRLGIHSKRDLTEKIKFNKHRIQI